MNIWFTSDQHFGHANILRYSRRPFRDASHMNDELVRLYNERVGEGDLVYHLGDFALNERLVPSILKRLRGRKILVAGNHDRCHRSHRDHGAWTSRYLGFGFEEVVQTKTLEIGGATVLLDHLPYRQQGGTEAQREGYADFRPENDGRFLLHGHVHTEWQVRERMINVGVDPWSYAPVSLGEIEAIVA